MGYVMTSREAERGTMITVKMPDGFSLDDCQEIASEAENTLAAEHIEVFGNFLGPEISRDMVRHILMATDNFRKEHQC